MNAVTVNRWMSESATAIAEQRDYLTQLDAAIGDADHGANMNRGFVAVQAKLAEVGRRRASGQASGHRRQHPGLDRRWRQRAALGHRAATRRQVARRCARRSSPTRSPTRCEAAVDSVVELGAAQPGDKTMVDALRPAVTAMKASLAGGADVATALAAASAAADEGMRATTPMLAQQGAGVVSGRALDRPPGPWRDLGVDHHRRARARGHRGAVSEAHDPRPSRLAGSRGGERLDSAARRGSPWPGLPSRKVRACARGLTGCSASSPISPSALRAEGTRPTLRSSRPTG